MRYALIALLLLLPEPTKLAVSTPTQSETRKVRIETVQTVQAKVTAYTSDPAETDDTPLITASQTRVRDGVVANNCLPFGTEVFIDGKLYVVEDRMNERYSNCDVDEGVIYFDIWMETKKQAINFGRQEKVVTIPQERLRSALPVKTNITKDTEVLEAGWTPSTVPSNVIGGALLGLRGEE